MEVRRIWGDIGGSATLREALSGDAAAIFHLGAVVSGQAVRLGFRSDSDMDEVLRIFLENDSIPPAP